MVIEAFDGNLYASVLDEVFVLEEVNERLDKSKEFDNVEVPKPKPKYIPPMNHPWRQYNFTKPIQMQKHRSDGAHI